MKHPIHTVSLFTVLTCSVLALTGCETSRQGSKTYTRGQAQQQMNIYTGTLLNVAAVTIEPEQTGGGSAVGGVAGGIAGSTIGSGLSHN